ncbi:MAG TPA: hypothetical protein VLA43_11910, partial [Longimicrobiales bacterium]|nr:hypothetical protein [Longimicrobiales bacterium]
APCREEVIAIRRILDARRRPALRAPGLLAAAASVVLLVSAPLVWYGTAHHTGLEPALRRSFPGPGPTVETRLPAVDGELPAGTPLRFVWSNAGEGSTFRLTLLDQAGNLVWTIDTGDTAATAPENLPLVGGETLFWYVDALSPDGRSSTSGPRSFRLR